MYHILGCGFESVTHFRTCTNASPAGCGSCTTSLDVGFESVFKHSRTCTNASSAGCGSCTTSLDVGLKVCLHTFKLVANAPDCSYLPLFMILDFLTKSLYMYVYSTSITYIFISPDLIQKLFTCEYMIR